MIKKVFSHALILIPVSFSLFLAFPLAAQPRQDVTVIYVDPDDGDDEDGSGNQENPFKTISQALKFAPDNSIIVLDDGKYDEDNGEVFPLKLTNGIMLQGDPKNQGDDIKIEGGGFFNSPTAARQNVTIVATQGAGGITGITVINPEDKGYGIWIESASPEITYNTLTENNNAALVVRGDSETKPLISHNYITDNPGKGIVVYDTTQPKIEDNTIEKSSYGLSILDSSVAVINNNKIEGNRTGITIEGQATGIFRNNIIENSKENGLIVINQAIADLGRQDDPGGNIFHNQGIFAIKNLTNRQSIISFGNQIEGKIEGEIDRSGGFSRVPDSLEVVTVKPTNSNSNTNIITNNNTNTQNSHVIQPPLPTVNQPSTTTVTSSWGQDPNGISINVPPPETNDIPKFQSPPVNVQPSNSPRRRNLADVLVVTPRPVVDPYTAIATNPTPVLNGNNQANFNSSNTIYRVLVQPRGSDQENTVKSLYPNAKTTVYQGQRMLEVATSSDRIKVENILQNLNNLGLNGLILE